MKTIALTFIVLLLILLSDGRKTSRGRGSSRGTSRRTYNSPKPVPPTSLSHAPPASAPKPSLFGWQEQRTAQRTHVSVPKQSKPTKTHSYPSSQTGLSGGGQPKQPPSHQENIQKSNVAHNTAGQQQSHTYPSSNGMSGKSSSGVGYPNAPNGLSGNQGTAGGYPSQHSSGHQTYPAGAAPPPYTSNNAYGVGHHSPNYHPQGPPPPYNNFGNNYGGYGGHGGGAYGGQMPGYFGNSYSNYGKGYGGVSRTSNVLKGVGIAGAGVGTILTGLALWNLARSTGRHDHTVIYDNRGQPVAVAPGNSSEPVVENDSILDNLINCTLTISNDNATEILAIPCAIATSFTPDADVKDVHISNETADTTKCTITILTKTYREFMTTIPCSLLLHTAAENNVTEPPLTISDTSTPLPFNESQRTNQPTALMYSTSYGDATSNGQNCTIIEPGQERDPINPCYAITNNVTVIPLEIKTSTAHIISTPIAA